jgi:hypothetical protein
MRDPIGDIRRYQRVFVLDRAQPSLADTNFMREFLLRGGAVATIAQFLDLLSIKPNFAHGVLFRTNATHHVSDRRHCTGTRPACERHFSPIETRDELRWFWSITVVVDARVRLLMKNETGWLLGRATPAIKLIG